MLRRGAEEGIRLMFHVTSEREWFVFAGAVASLYLTSLAATRFDFITLCFIGIVGAMSVLAVYVKNEQRIRGYAEKLRVRSERLSVRIEEKLQRVKTRVAGKH